MPLGPETGCERPRGGNALVACTAGHASLEPARGSPHSAFGVPEVRRFAPATPALLGPIAPGNGRVAWCDSPHRGGRCGLSSGAGPDFFSPEKIGPNRCFAGPTADAAPVLMGMGTAVASPSTEEARRRAARRDGASPFNASQPARPATRISSMISSLSSSPSRPARVLSSLVCGCVIAAISVIVVVMA